MRNGSNKNREIYRRVAERETYDAGAAREKARRDQQDGLPLGERQLYA